jgi:hypothetical protein
MYNRAIHQLHNSMSIIQVMVARLSIIQVPSIHLGIIRLNTIQALAIRRTTTRLSIIQVPANCRNTPRFYSNRASRHEKYRYHHLTLQRCRHHHPI